MTIYIALNITNNNIEPFNSVKYLAEFIGIDARTAKKHLNSNKPVSKIYLLSSKELNTYRIKRKKGYNVSANGLKQHNEDDFY